MDIQGYFTAKGQALTAKLLSGETLAVTRVAAGSGHTAKPSTATALPQIQQELAVNTPTHSGDTAVIPATLTAAQAKSDYTLTELGVYARDPDEGEILYKIYRLSEPVDITAGSRSVLRFFLEETVSQDLDVTVVCSPAGLITEEDFLPVQSKVLATGRTATVSATLDAAQLQSYLDGLPRLMTGNVTLTVSGTLETALSIHDFYGPGFLTIQATADAPFVLTQGGTVSSCGAPVVLRRLTCTSPEGHTGNVLYFADCGAAYLDTCTVTGSGQDTGISTDRQNYISASHCKFSRLANVVLARNNSVVWLDCDSAGDCHDNQVGVYVWHGGTAMLCGSTPDLVGGSANKRQGGGMIVSAAGTLL